MTVADFVGILPVWYFRDKYPVQTIIKSSYALSSFGGILIVCWGLENQSGNSWLILVFIAKVGIVAVLVELYKSHTSFCPILFSATSLGYCNFFSRGFTVFAFSVGKVQEPIPMLLFTLLCLVGFFLPQFLTVENQIEPIESKQQ